MPPKRKAPSYETRVASRRRVAENNPHLSHLTVHPAAGEVQQQIRGTNQPPAQEDQSVNTGWLENLGKNIAAAMQKSMQEAGIKVTNPQAPSQPEIEYVDFSVIFNNSSNSEDHYTFKVQNGQGGGQPTLSLVPSVKKQPVHTIEQWTTAFQAFVVVYCERFPSKRPN